jgi:hypothetical protein
MFFDLLLAPITLPVNGIAWIGEKILEQTGSNLNDKEQLQKRLLSLQLAFDLGEIDEASFETQEEELLLAIQAIEAQADQIDR